MAEIYALFSGRDGKVRYVGQTLGSHETRFKEHQRRLSDGSDTPVYRWIHGEFKAGFPVWSILLEECSDDARYDIETQWISRFPHLLNLRKRGYYWHHCKPPVIREIKSYMGRFVFNSGGYRGIHWWRQLDRYSVFVYDGCEWDWLPGDGAPGWTGDIWYSDRAQALKGRDHHRRQAYRSLWLPDIRQGADWAEVTWPTHLDYLIAPPNRNRLSLRERGRASPGALSA
jgi:hypothetical protein